MTDQVESRISSELYDPPTILSVVATSKCNLDCSFCGGAYYMDREDTSREFQREEILSALEKNPSIEEINWTGGEPLLAQRKIEDFINELKVIRPNLRHRLYTNGLKMRKAHLPLLKQFDTIFVSIDGYEKSERPFLNFVKDGNHEALEVLYELDNYHSWAVLTRDQLGDKRWYEDVIELHRALYHYRPGSLTLLFDAMMLKPLSPDHTMNFMYGFWQLQDNIERLNVQNGTSCGVAISKMFDTKCNTCSEVLWLNADGTQEQIQNAPEILDVGCNRLARSIGVDAYNYINRVISAKRDRVAKDEQQ
ncbi:radical SAM protein [Salmonella enterica]|uniref:radical SAM protein n=1 Tax=Salmonella enterica TaxID=28901 RepID=UPI0010FB025D|nr:radical SAM protein [Salmonella enterica]EBZ7571638.1 radical SAM protein [Salmonella enterica subsp. enterica serovar Infantis]HCJ9458837.1 radical SAM protein [Escherichia coli]EBO6938129.1 radical SAM protein [Salmonella enterica]EHV4349900.1 radical SAM protein [Salmonella enterica]EID8267593.1 radical SAM protein [Salmonella enterica]